MVRRRTKALRFEESDGVGRQNFVLGQHLRGLFLGKLLRRVLGLLVSAAPMDARRPSMHYNMGYGVYTS
eukprot:6199867-Pleurochrysis_carterae.AAC.1